MGKSVTMKDIARSLNLSINAISLALNDKPGISEETKRQVLKRAEEMGYLEHATRFNKAFANLCVCILIKKKFYTSSFYSKVIYGVEKQAKEEGYNVILQFYSDDCLIPDCVRQRKVCGVIIAGSIEEEYLIKLYESGLPIILVDHSSYSLPIDCILTDNRIGSYESVANLIHLGYKKIGFFGDFTYSLSNKERFWGYVEAIQKIEPDFKELFQYVSRYSILGDIEKFVIRRDTEEIVKIVKSQEVLPEVFQCTNDRAAMILNNALGILNIKVPDQIGLVGFDDGEIASIMYPTLTTVHVATVRMGVKAFERLVWRMNNRKSPPEKLLMSVEPVIRDSIRH